METQELDIIYVRLAIQLYESRTVVFDALTHNTCSERKELRGYCHAPVTLEQQLVPLASHFFIISSAYGN